MSQIVELIGGKNRQSAQKLAILVVLSMVLVSSLVEARSFAQLSANNYEQSDNNPLLQGDDSLSSDLVIERALNYAADLGCKNMGELIWLARSKPVKDPSELLDLMESIRSKKAITKHTPRFGR